MKNNKKLTIAAIIIIAALLISMVGTALVRTNAWSVQEIRFTGSLKEVADMIRDNTAENGKTVDILFTEDDSAQFCMTTYIPQNATKDSPAPVVIGAHGWNNTQEMQMSNIVELTRRGFVVVVMDLGGHGRSDAAINDYTQTPAGQNTEGVVAAVEYAMSLSCVDIDRIGVTGHSAGDLATAYTLNYINTDASVNHIHAFFCPTGTISSLFVNPTALEGDLILGIASGKYDELDTYYFGTADFLGDTSKYNPTFGFVTPAFLVSRYYPEIMGQTVEEGVFYGAEGAITMPEPGTAMAERHACVVYNPPVTHVMGTFSKVATQESVDFFYAAFGTPAGASYIPGSSQVWGWATVFQTIGLLAFFASALVIGAWLLKTKAFASLNNAPVDRKELPALKSWKEIVPAVITFVPLFLMAQLYFKCFAAGEELFDSAKYTLPTVNGVAWFTLVTGVITFAMLVVNYIVKSICHAKDGAVVASPFAPAYVDSAGKFIKTLGFAAAVLVLMYIPCYIGYKWFNMSFGISVYTVGLPRMKWLPEILFRYLPFWLVFALANAIINNMTRFKDVPDWATTAFCTVANVLPVIVMIIINYSHLINKGLTKYAFGDPSIMSWNLLAPMVFVGISGRYFYKKTGNSWAGALINAAIICLMATTITRHTGMYMFG